MSSSTLITESQVPGLEQGTPLVRADRIGVVASVLCAIHCAVTPLLLLLLPSFGRVWAHPASHWGMALFVVPLAVVMLSMGYRRHRRTWVLATGGTGILLVIVGAILPYLTEPPAEVQASDASSQESEIFVYNAGDPLLEVAEEGEIFVYNAGDSLEGANCVDLCCPSFVVNADGEKTLYIPPASIVTTLGGVALIATHLGNLVCCSSCRRRRLLDL